MEKISGERTGGEKTGGEKTGRRNNSVQLKETAVFEYMKGSVQRTGGTNELATFAGHSKREGKGHEYLYAEQTFTNRLFIVQEK